VKIDPERWLRRFLRLVGAGCLLATVAAALPASWLDALHARTGLPGDYGAAPITDYLARSTSLWWAFMGGGFLVASADVRRFRPLIVYLAVALSVIGAALVVVDIALAFPWWWVVGEFLLAAPVAAVVLVLLRGVAQQPSGGAS
jgi:hypothetical protein